MSGFQLYYSGLCNITDEQNSITAPVQNFMEHYKTAKGETALTSSSFIMLLAFNDTVNSIHDNWPDRNDTLYASFSLGLDLNTVFGCARTTKGVKLSDVTIHQFLEQKHIKMSIVLFQNSLTLNQSTKSTYNNQNVTDAELDVSNGAVTTTVGNDKIFETEFGTKPKYSLYNITDGYTTQYNALARTTSRAGYARNPLFNIQEGLLKYIPIIVAHIDPAIYEKAKDHITSMEYSDCLYVISYPTYGGYKVVHDPTFTAYVALTAKSATSPFGLIVLGSIVAAGAAGTVYIVKRRRSKTVHA